MDTLTHLHLALEHVGLTATELEELSKLPSPFCPAKSCYGDCTHDKNCPPLQHQHIVTERLIALLAHNQHQKHLLSVYDLKDKRHARQALARALAYNNLLYDILLTLIQINVPFLASRPEQYIHNKAVRQPQERVALLPMAQRAVNALRERKYGKQS